MAVTPSAFRSTGELIELAFFMNDHGVPLDTIRAVAHKGLDQAKPDYRTKHDPFDRLAAA